MFIDETNGEIPSYPRSQKEGPGPRFPSVIPEGKCDKEVPLKLHGTGEEQGNGNRHSSPCGHAEGYAG